jgi:hypothetical protein
MIAIRAKRMLGVQSSTSGRRAVAGSPEKVGLLVVR